MSATRPLFIPVILGTARRGRASYHVAKFVHAEVAGRDGVETELVDICDLPFPTTDAGEAIKDSRFSATVARADALVLVVPEYNHGYPGLLKHALDTNLKEYIHKAGGICGVSAAGSAHTVIANLLTVVRRGGVNILWTAISPARKRCLTLRHLLDQLRRHRQSEELIGWRRFEIRARERLGGMGG